MSKLKVNKTNLLVFAICTAVVFAKLLMFNYHAYHEPWQGVWEKLSAAIFLSSFVFLFKDKRWILPVMFFVDAWCVSNLVYVRSNNLILDSFAMTMAGGMNGFWDSIFIFFQASDLDFFLITFVLWFVLRYIKTPERSTVAFFSALAVAVVFNYAGAVHTIVTADDKTLADDFSLNVYTRSPRENIYGNRLLDEACSTSIMHTLIYTPLDYIALKKGKQPEALPLSPCQDEFVQSLLKQDRNPQTDRPMLILLVESFESWVCTPYIMPNLCKFIENEHVLFADKMVCQTIGAESADGQMIVVSGLLPVHEGASCFRFPDNEYPTVMKAQKNKSYILLPHDESVWNQVKMSPAYGMDTTVFVSPVDSVLFSQIIDVVNDGARSLFAITMSTHSPFKAAGSLSSLELPEHMPYGMKNYVRGFNTVDAGMKQLLDFIENDSVMQQFTVVITGDHTIFHKERRDMFADYADENDNLPVTVNGGYLPLIIYSPDIKHNMRYDNVCYQMDVYPTVMHILGAGNYYWQGFGINLTDTTALRHPLPIDCLPKDYLSKDNHQEDYPTEDYIPKDNHQEDYPTEGYISKDYHHEDYPTEGYIPKDYYHEDYLLEYYLSDLSDRLIMNNYFTE